MRRAAIVLEPQYTLTSTKEAATMLSVGLDALIFVTGWLHVLSSPFSKVEESFNLHATHDVLMYGVGIDNLYNYDHFTFPGAVPRTFIGSILLAWLATPFVIAADSMGFTLTKFDLQILVRLILASLSAWSLCTIRRATSRRFGKTAGSIFTALTCSQFHLPFWMGRTVPNTFAMIPVNFSTYFLINGTPRMIRQSSRNLNAVIGLLTFTAVVFRAEVALLLAPLSLQLLRKRHIVFWRLVQVGLISGLLSLALTILVDSYFWGKELLWPEFSGIYFNVFEGKSSEWGTSPPLTYFVLSLPKLLAAGLPLSIFGLIVDRQARSLIIPPLVFISLMSCLGHKEWRFIVYTVPIFNIAASLGMTWVLRLRKPFVFLIAAAGILGVNFAYQVLLTAASVNNYPGGDAMVRFHQLYTAIPTAPITTRILFTRPQPSTFGHLTTPAHIHISNLAAQSGASLFLHLNSPPYLSPSSAGTPWIYNKTENLSPTSFTSPSTPFTHLISEISPENSSLGEIWQTKEAIQGFDRYWIDWNLLKGRKEAADLWTRLTQSFVLKKSDKLWILERKAI
ncbi:unnamed protein product [Cyclocybe aegerita]|uniref:Mannosyltransferase n=1 Tax=Cyclocybe aegerita TaxID=1973307 RepID=A0A8S0XRG7_CYCAE|nr:unnamed protein product [Cyclocybe aegerita]